MAAANQDSCDSRAIQVSTSLDDRGQALQILLSDRLARFELVPGAVLDIPQIQVEPRQIVDVCKVVKDDPSLDFNMLLCLMAIDYRKHFQVAYVLLSLRHEQKLFIKTDLPYDDPKLQSVTSIWRAAEWYEREAHDLFGIVFTGHPDLAPLLLYEGFEGFPGRKEFPFHDYQEY